MLSTTAISRLRRPDIHAQMVGEELVSSESAEQALDELTTLMMVANA